MDFMKYFMLIIDNEVVGQIPSAGLYMEKDSNEEAEKYYAILSSNPSIVAADEFIPEGSIWDGQNFIPAV
jgi:hypothetical protein